MDQIDQIVQLHLSKSGAATKELMSGNLRKLERSARVCTQEALDIKKEFDYWTEFTVALSTAVVGGRGSVQKPRICPQPNFYGQLMFPCKDPRKIT